MLQVHAPLTNMPPAPTSSDGQAQFDDRADVFMPAIGVLQQQMNQFIAGFNANIAALNTIYAAAPSGGTGITALSSSLVTIGAGARVVAVPEGGAWVPGMRVKIVDTSDFGRWMVGDVNSYAGGQLAVAVSMFSGSGSGDAWGVFVYDMAALAERMGGLESVAAIMQLDAMYRRIDSGLATMGHGQLDDFETLIGVAAGDSSNYTHEPPGGGTTGSLRTVAPATGQVIALDLGGAAVTHENHQGPIARLVVDTANTAGHFEDAGGAAMTIGACGAASGVRVGSRVLLAGGADPVSIDSITGAGDGVNAVTLKQPDGTTATLPAGAYIVEAIRATAVQNGKTQLASYGATEADLSVVGAPVSSTPYPGYEAARAFDGNNATSFATAESATSVIGKYVGRNFGGAQTIQTMRFVQLGGGGTTVTSVKVQGDAGGGWYDIQTFSGLGTDNLLTLNQPVTVNAMRIVATVATTQYAWHVHELTFYGQAGLYPTGVVATAIAPSVGTSAVGDITALALTAEPNAQTLLFALSFDGGATWRAHDGAAWRDIARHNAGQWEYRGAADVWIAADANTAHRALSLASAYAANHMTGATLAGLTKAAFYGVLGSTLAVAMTLHTTDAAVTPTADALTITYDAKAPAMTLASAPWALGLIPVAVRVDIAVQELAGPLDIRTQLIVDVCRDGVSWERVALAKTGQANASAYLVSGEAVFLLGANGQALQMRVQTLAGAQARLLGRIISYR